MIRLQRILCPVDLSEFSRRALHHAVALARWYDADVTALSVRPTVLTPTPWVEYPASFPLESPEDRQRADDAVRAFVRETAGPVGANVVLKEGPVVSEIITAAMELPADLIVMGTHGLSGFERFVLGSVTEKVLRKAPCPVLTVPPASAVADTAVAFKTIVCGVDFSPASRRAFDHALSLAEESGGHLVLVHVLEWFAAEEPRISAHFNVSEYRHLREREAREQLGGWVPEEARTWCDPEVVIGYGKPYAELLRVATEKRADLLVLGVHGHTILDLALFGSTTQHIVREAVCPVLTVRSEARAAAVAA